MFRLAVPGAERPYRPQTWNLRPGEGKAFGSRRGAPRTSHGSPTTGSERAGALRRDASLPNADNALVRVPWFYSPTVTSGMVELPVGDLQHAGTALRMRKGDAVVLFDGAGTIGHGRIAELKRATGQILVERIEQDDDRAAVRLTLAIAMPKAHRQSMLLEKCTELNVAAIWPMSTDRTVVRPAHGLGGRGSEATAQLTRWRRATIEAAKQCHRARLPELEEIQTLPAVVERVGSFGRAIIAHPSGSAIPLAQVLRDLRPSSMMLALIGPEGGWTDAEHALATAAGAIPVSLGPSVLRVETAAIAIAAAMSLLVDVSV